MSDTARYTIRDVLEGHLHPDHHGRDARSDLNDGPKRILDPGPQERAQEGPRRTAAALTRVAIMAAHCSGFRWYLHQSRRVTLL